MPIVDADYLVNYWHDLGLCGAGSMGATALSALEISAWASLNALELEPWEFSALRQMSQNYVQYLYQGENPGTPPPYGAIVKEFDRDLVEKKLTGAFKAFIMAGKK